MESGKLAMEPCKIRRVGYNLEQTQSHNTWGSRKACVENREHLLMGVPQIWKSLEACHEIMFGSRCPCVWNTLLMGVPQIWKVEDFEQLCAKEK